MVDWPREMERLQRARARVLGMGGEMRVDRQHKLGKLTVRERLDLLLDPGTFLEYGKLATFFGLSPEDEKYAAADGVVTGFGKIDGRLACVIAEDFTVQGGSLGNSHFAKKIRILKRVTKDKVPVILLLDGSGARAEQETVEGPPVAPHHALLASLSGLVPLVACALGPCFGDSSILGQSCELIIVARGIGQFGIAGPPVVKTATSEEISKEDLAGSKIHCYETGVADNEATSEAHAFEIAREYLSFLPSNCWEEPPYSSTSDPVDRMDEELPHIIPDNYQAPYDVKRVIRCIVDDGHFFERKPLYGRNVVTALARMGGHPVGIIANQPMVLAGALDVKAAYKARQFIDICNSFHIPLLFLADCPGVMPGRIAEQQATLRAGLAFVHSAAFLRVPVISIILRKAFGLGGTSMGLIGQDQVLIAAWPSATFSSLPSAGSAAVARKTEVASDADPERLRKEMEAKFEETEGPYLAAGAYRIDEIIDPRETRPTVIRHLEVARQRRKEPLGPAWTHGIKP
jgi:acetyl-CoA carboxylase carboxyltransferase component